MVASKPTRAVGIVALLLLAASACAPQPASTSRAADTGPALLQLTPYVVRKGVTGALPANPLNPPGLFAHTWDIE